MIAHTISNGGFAKPVGAGYGLIIAINRKHVDLILYPSRNHI